MDEYIEIIKLTDRILNEAEKLDNDTERQAFLKEYLLVFKKFKNSLNIILPEYLSKEKDNQEQNEASTIVKKNIIRLVKNKDIFEEGTEYEYFLANMLKELNWNEGKYAFRLQNEKDFGKIESALEYLQDRDELKRVLIDNNLFEGQSITEAEARQYVSNEFEQSLYGHILMQIKNNFLNMPKEMMIDILNKIDTSSFFKELISKDSKKMSFYEKNLMYQYCEVVLKMKAIFTPNELKDDVVIKQMWNGKIEDDKTLNYILANTSIKSLIDISEYYDETDYKGFIMHMSEHFKEVGLSSKNISIIMKKVFDSQRIIYEYANFLAQIDIPSDYRDFLDSESSRNFEWLTDFATFESLKKCEKNIEEAYRPFLPAEYYIKKIDKLYESKNLNYHFIGNLITLLHSDYYSLEEKEELKNALERKGLYSEYITDEKIVFEHTDSVEDTQIKVKKAYYSGQVIPIDIAQKLLNGEITNTIYIDKEVLQGCVQSVIYNNLKANNIDIQNKVFFGNGNGTLGYNDSYHLSIWIDDSLLENFLRSNELSEKAELFKTMFHEMQHAIQNDNMKKGRIDFLTYNFIKEEIIEEYDLEFYSANYKKIFTESDARKEEILGALEFFNGLNPEFAKNIISYMEEKYEAEVEEHSISSDSKKKFAIGKDSYIDVSEYVGMLIQNNPIILEENPIFAIEYNQNGTRKDIRTMLKEYKERKKEGSNEDIYSIYYGIIVKKIENTQIEDVELKKQVKDFMQKGQKVFTLDDLKKCCSLVDEQSIKQAYKRLYSIIHKSPEKDTDDNER